jgi:hypothetical protein
VPDLSAPPVPMPNNFSPAPGTQPKPSMAGLAGKGTQSPSISPGANQIGGAAVRMALEIDQALKLLAQAVPTLGPWVEKTAQELRAQIGAALNAGAVPVSPQPQDNARFPGGGGNL